MDSDKRALLIRSSATLTSLAGAALGLPLAARSTESRSAPDIYIELRAEPHQIQIRAGAMTSVWRYRGRLIHGEAAALDESAGGYLGPIIRVRRGQRVRIDLVNDLPEPTIIHWHGLQLPDDMDGHPRFAVAPGERYVYAFTIRNRAGSYWFHPHPHGRTGKQVYSGLAGLFIVSDDEEAAAGLPTGPQDIPLVVQDRTFDSANQLVYLGKKDSPGMGSSGMMGRRGGGGMGSMMAGMMGVLGDQILVNGRTHATRVVPRRAHRLRLLNAANARTLKLAWSDGSPMTVIGTDGGLLARPVQREYVMLGPAERIELWVNFDLRDAGSEVALRSLSFDGGIMGSHGDLPDGSAFDIQNFRMDSGPTMVAAEPTTLSNIVRADPRLAVNHDKAKVFDLTMGMMVWGINGAKFDMLGVSELETVKLGTHEIWEFRNEGRGSMMGMVMPHAMHVHGLQFQVLSRGVMRKFEGGYRTVNAGFVDEGWKDTVLVMPGERVRVLLRFSDYTGLFLYHCHMLEHEDTGLMRNYLVKA